MLPISHLLRLWLLAMLMLLSACTRGPDQATLKTEVQTRLAQQLKPGLLELVSLKRQGSAPLPANEDGSERIVVYFNATLRFAEDYAFGSWEQLSPASLAYLLGATEKGVSGIKPQNKTGDLLYVYGSTTYAKGEGGWQSVASSTAGTAVRGDFDNTAPPLRSKQMIDKLAAMVEIPPPGVGPAADTVISEELDRAAENIQRRLQRRQHVYTFASGPREGQYLRFGETLVAGALKAGARGDIRNRETEGSVQNVRLLLNGEADYALVQSNVAAAAVAGGAPFAGNAATSLRALGSLFPEPIQIVVRSNSAFRKLADLRGKRIDIGTRSSGTQHDAMLVLAAHGLKASEVTLAQDGGDAALQRLQKGELDAVFITMAAPARSLQPLATRRGIRLLSLQESAVDKLVEQNHGLVPITLPAYTYPGQDNPVRTVATVALLVTTSEVPDAEVERLTKLVWGGGLDFAGSAEGARVSRQTALLGITIPMHPGASRYFGAGGKP